MSIGATRKNWHRLDDRLRGRLQSLLPLDHDAERRNTPMAGPDGTGNITQIGSSKGTVVHVGLRASPFDNELARGLPK